MFCHLISEPVQCLGSQTLLYNGGGQNFPFSCFIFGQKEVLRASQNHRALQARDSRKKTLNNVSFEIKSHGFAEWGEMKCYEVKKKWI